MAATRALPVIWHEGYEVDIGPHVFPTRKYRLVRNRLLGEGTITERDVERPGPATREELSLVHTTEYLRKIEGDDFTLEEVARLEVPFTAALREASVLCVGGSILAARRALERGAAAHLAGGHHHAFPDHGEGFCLLNDVAVALRVLLAERTIRRAVVIDLDVHHGNGTATIFQDDERVFTFSVHQEHNYPVFKPPSDLDVGLPDGTGDDEYLCALEEHVPRILREHRPELAFYLAGADPYEWDQLGGLKLTLPGLRRRDDFVCRALRRAGVAVAVVLAGGYAVETDDTVEIHCGSVRAAQSALEQ
ncbi:MAG: histone deacetylase [Gemmatimonadetes bacterium]|nr:histone deacetylase [Gemmatimonadota bacterium]